MVPFLFPSVKPNNPVNKNDIYFHLFTNEIDYHIFMIMILIDWMDT